MPETLTPTAMHYAPGPGTIAWKILKYLKANPTEQLTRADVCRLVDCPPNNVEGNLQLAVAREALMKGRNSKMEVYWRMNPRANVTLEPFCEREHGLPPVEGRAPAAAPAPWDVILPSKALRDQDDPQPQVRLEIAPAAPPAPAPAPVAAPAAAPEPIPEPKVQSEALQGFAAAFQEVFEDVFGGRCPPDREEPVAEEPAVEPVAPTPSPAPPPEKPKSMTTTSTAPFDPTGIPIVRGATEAQKRWESWLSRFSIGDQAEVPAEGAQQLRYAKQRYSKASGRKFSLKKAAGGATTIERMPT